MQRITKLALVGLIAVSSVGLSGCGMIFPPYRVWEQEQAGKARLAEARGSRQIAVEVAKANLEASKLNAEAEVVRARGTDEANRVMAQSLGGPENYLAWSYIDMLRDTAGKGDRQVIYLPTDGGLPVLEAGRLAK